MGNLFSFNGSNVDFGSIIDANDWYKKQLDAKMLSSGLLNLLLGNNLKGITNIAPDKLTNTFKTPNNVTEVGKSAVESGTKIAGKLTNETSNFGTKLKGFAGTYGGVIGDAASTISNLVGKRGLDGQYGHITKNMDAAYDTIQKAAASFGPVGNIVSGAMGVGKLLGNVVSKIGGGTDGVTKTDAIMNSAFLNLTPLGLINGFGGKKAKTYTRNDELDTATNGGFLGFLKTEDITQIGAGKKYGLFSSGARKKQDALTEFTLNMKHTISGIVDTNTINNLAAQGSTPFLALQQSVDLNGGIQQMRAARLGMQFSRRVVSKYQIGNRIKRSIQTIDVATGKYVDLPTDLTKEQINGQAPIKLANGMVVFMLKNGTVTSDKWETVGEREHLTPKGLNGIKLPNWMFYDEEYDQYATDLYDDSSKEQLDYLNKLMTQPLLKKYTIWKDPKLKNRRFIITKEEASRRGWNEFNKLNINSGSSGNEIIPAPLGMSVEIDGKTYISNGDGTYDDGTGNIYLFKQGGQMNVIPEGALHARLNHLDLVDEEVAKAITNKGIPVISVEEGGEIVQHAEIEHSEIIFTLDVTNKIEDLRKKWHKDKEDKYAIEAGKLLTHEILHNTDDRTNLIENIE